MFIMKNVFSIILLLATFSVNAQSINYIDNPNFNDEQREILKVVITLFDGMREGDSAKVHSVFRNHVEFHTSLTNKEGQPILLNDDLQPFLNAVGTTHDKIWDEPLWDIDIKIDNNLASVWTKYAFYIGNEFSHCGVDAFMLNKDENGWKIFHLTDTRQRNGCEVPNEIKTGRDL